VLARHGLAAYARHPLLRTVSLDRTFYAPLTVTLAAALFDAGAVPCLAVHARMPPVAEQAVAFNAGGGNQPLVVRWNLHAGRDYAGAKSDFFPFDRLIEEDHASRRALAHLASTAATAGRDIFITINNKAEGSAPRSVEALAAAIGARVGTGD
jgi:uncharacterized protein YecE (DUF72 family)